MAEVSFQASIFGHALQYTPAGLSWAALMAAAGNGVYESGTFAYVTYFSRHDTNENQWVINHRAIIMFDTSSIPDTAIITGANLKVQFRSKSGGLSVLPDVGLYGANPANDDHLVDADYGCLGSILLCDTPIPYVDWDGSETFILNAAGRAAISKTGLTKLGLKNANYDAGIAPDWTLVSSTNIQVQGKDHTTFAYRPILTVYYDPPEAAGAKSFACIID